MFLFHYFSSRFILSSPAPGSAFSASTTLGLMMMIPTMCDLIWRMTISRHSSRPIALFAPSLHSNRGWRLSKSYSIRILLIFQWWGRRIITFVFVLMHIFLCFFCCISRVWLVGARGPEKERVCAIHDESLQWQSGFGVVCQVFG